MLSEIVARKRVDVAERMRIRPLPQLLSGLEPSQRSLAQALRRPGAQLICECKRASPSQGLIRQDFDPCAIAAAYAPFAAAMSVITDTPYFQGQLSYIQQARKAFDGPILCKDFVVDPYQVVEARHYGADAVLVMLSVLNDDEARACLAMAQRWGMDALVETHNADELSRALALDAAIIGINNRDLHSLKVSLEVTERLASSVPNDRLLISESGVKTRADLLRLSKHVDGFLVGTSLMRQPDVGRALRELLFGRVKVCGLTRPADAMAAWRAGASFGGVIFAARSARRVTLEQAREVVAAAPLSWVGVFVDEAAELVAHAAQELGLDAVQLHGSESTDYRAALRQRLPGCAIWQAVPVDVARLGAEAAEATARRSEAAREGSDRLLYDSRVASSANGWAQPGGAGGAEGAGGAGGAGGTGRVFPREALSQVRMDEAVLAGGLDAGNVAANSRLGAWALDVNSGVESRPGVKSVLALGAVFEALRPGCRRSSEP